MGFDVYFVDFQPGQSCKQVMDALEAAYDESAGFTPDADAQWNQLARRIQEVLPDAKLNVANDIRGLVQTSTGIQFLFSPCEISLHVPYWYEGAAADRVIGTLRAVASLVEDVTGLTAYDPQAEQPFLIEEPGAAQSSFQFGRAAMDALALGTDPDTR
jgi:hypothetical protein